MRTVFQLLGVLALATCVQAQTAQTSKYDKFTDETTVSVRYFHPIKGVNMEAQYKYQGRAERIMPPKIISLIFVSAGDVYSLEGAELFVLSDDNRFRFKSSFLSEHFIDVQIPFDKFESLIAGKKIEMRLGTYELSLSDDDFKALRNFLPRKLSP